MKALFVSTHFPKDFNQAATGAFKRMSTFLEALQARASIQMLFYYRPELELDSKRFAEVKSALKEAWHLDDHDLIVCRQDPEPSHGDRLWDGYLARASSLHRQVGFVRTSGRHQLTVFEECLDEKPDLVFAHRLNTICPMLLTMRRLPPIFMDLDDIEHKAFLREVSQPPKWMMKRLWYLQVPALLWGERRAIKLSAKTFVCSGSDAAYLSKKLRMGNVRVIPNSVCIPEVQSLVKQQVLLFLGMYGYGPNAVAAEELVTRIWPIVREACPEAWLIIAGPGPERIPSFTRRENGVEYTGFVEDLDALYRRSRVVCCPILSGGGTRIKIIEAAAYGKPIVSTRIGAEGLDFEDSREILLRDDSRAFAKACIKLLGDDALCEKIGKAARAKAIARYERQSIVRLIQNEIFAS